MLLVDACFESVEIFGPAMVREDVEDERVEAFGGIGGKQKRYWAGSPIVVEWTLGGGLLFGD
jgi:hypothetical protein